MCSKFVYHRLLFKSLGKILPCSKNTDVCLCSMPLPLHYLCHYLYLATTVDTVYYYSALTAVAWFKFNFPVTFCNNILQLLIPFQIEKLKILGITWKEAQWLDSYISNRTELVETTQKKPHNSQSKIKSTTNTTGGVSQGSCHIIT